VCCQFSTEVSVIILCPLAQPNKAVGLESHIGSWLACYPSQHSCLRSFTSRGRRTTMGNMKPMRYNPQPAWSRSANMRLAHSVGLDASQTAFPLGEKGRVFFLTSPLIGLANDNRPTVSNPAVHNCLTCYSMSNFPMGHDTSRTWKFERNFPIESESRGSLTAVSPAV